MSFDLESIRAGGMYTSLKGDTTEDKMKLLAAMGQADVKGEELEKEPLSVADVMLHPVTITDEKTGASVDCVRTVLISPDGRTAAFVSDGIVSSLGNVIQVFGEPTWTKPLLMQVVQVNTRKGRRTYNLRVVG